ncbi:bifunctional UDP-N-acetylglucosamine diphosphorylase/glucosamine-1-phosphate N-acetyltransferase GlmU [Massilia sp. W12]|uniref:bifunctional UDP-N-acetylglucosamine diphosphorylase/glucosamine-1-phosphate N-acetyltransferase GlmU n=1 Tax=Massilia sp. W12 TaxID=3126507 RepID=UPI0030D5F72A
MNVVILAAGMGKRMQSALPKVLHPLAGKPLVQHVVETAHSLGAQHICVVYGHGGDLVCERLTKACPDIPLNFALQQPQLGTGHAVQQAVPHLGDSPLTLVLYGDVPLISAQTLQALLAVGAPDRLALLTMEVADPTGLGRIVRDQGAIRRIVEHKDATPQELQIREINTGIMLIPTAHLGPWLAALKNENAQGEYYLTDIVAQAVAQGLQVASASAQAEFEILGVNSKQQLAQLERLYQAHQAQTLLAAGVTLMDPARLDIRGKLRCGRDVSIDVNCVFEGDVELGEGVQIGANCVLKNVSIAAGAVIHPFCHLEGAIVGAGALVGPYARLRPGAELAQQVHIGNFVEVKNVQIGPGSKANHLAYLGDGEVGARVNIGAGTIFCNYDGVNKFRTVIEDDVFIGSDSQLVAPVRVGAGATIGAGSTITQDAPAGKLSLARGRQVTIESWQRPQKKPKA